MNFVAFGNNELASQPLVKDGGMVDCPHCQQQHAVEYGKNERGEPTATLGFYLCGKKSYLASVNGRLVTGLFPREKKP